MKRQIVCTAVLAICTALGMTGCETNKGKDERSSGRTSDDKELSSKIRKSLDEEPVFKFGNVDVKTYAGEVQLSGFVNTEEQKDRAGQIAAQTPGVMKVYNSLALKPFAPVPTGYTNAPRNTIYSTPPQEKQAPSTAAPEQKDEPK